MKKIFIVISLMLTLCLSFVSCNNSSDNDTNSNTQDDEDLDNQDILDTDDTSIQIEYDAEREAKDNEFPFDNIIIERYGYDIVAAGKYYGNDFDSVTDYGSYYRIIDNYVDFSELTAWGNQVDESAFDENVVLVLHSYKSYCTYNSIKHEKGSFIELKSQTNSEKISLIEMWVRSSRAEIVDGEIVVKTNEENVILFPMDVKETLYLLIPKEELPENLPVNGEICLLERIEEME